LPPVAEKKKITFKEKREFEQLGKEIAQLEKEKKIITEQLNNRNTSFSELQDISLRINEINQLLDEKELRWLFLSEHVGTWNGKRQIANGKRK